MKANGQLDHPSKRTAVRNKMVKQFETMSEEQMDEAFWRANRKQIAKLYLKAIVSYSLKVSLRKFRA